MRKRTVLLTLGGLFLLAALALTARNLRQEARAQTAAEQTLQTLAPIVQTAADAQTPLEAEAVPADEQVIPDYQLDPQMEMPVTTIDGVDYIGVLEIPALDLSVRIYQGTDSKTLAKGIGHFKNTSIWNGNVCLAAHNRGANSYFGQIHTLDIGDKITLTTRLGTRTYKVTDVSKVSETDRGGLADSGENMLTLYTCVRNQRDQRWCVTAAEV